MYIVLEGETEFSDIIQAPEFANGRRFESFTEAKDAFHDSTAKNIYLIEQSGKSWKTIARIKVC